MRVAAVGDPVTAPEVDRVAWLARLELERWSTPPPHVLPVVHDLRRVIRLLAELLDQAHQAEVGARRGI